MNITSTDRPRLEGLPSLRGFAAIPVILFHQLGLLQIKEADTAPRWYRSAVEFGHVGLEFFFVLSGFILAYVYAHSTRPIAKKRFWRARFARLYPIYLLSLVLLAPVYFWTESIEPTFSPALVGVKAGLTLVLLQAWMPTAALAWSFVAWSLSVEVFFYLLVPWLLPAMLRLSRRQLVLFAGALWAAVVLAGVVFAWRDPGMVHWKASDEVGYPWTHILRYNPIANLPKFVLGMTGGVLFLDHAKSERDASLATRLVLVAVAVLAVGAVLRHHVHLAIIETGLLSPALVLIVYGFALQPRWSTPFRGRWMDLFGDLSYAMYLFHPVILVAMWVSFEAFRPLGLLPMTAFYLVTVLVLSLLAHFLVERPAERRLRGPRS